MPAPDQVVTQLNMVEDLAIGNDPNGFIFVCKWLAPAVHIHDGEPRVSQVDSRAAIRAYAFGAAMVQHIEHRSQCLRVSSPVEPASNPAHSPTSLPLIPTSPQHISSPRGSSHQLCAT